MQQHNFIFLNVVGSIDWDNASDKRAVF